MAKRGWQIVITDYLGPLPADTIFLSKRKATKYFIKLDRDFGEFCTFEMYRVKIK